MAEYKAMLSDGSMLIFDSEHSLDNLYADMQSHRRLTVSGGRMSFGEAGSEQVEKTILNEAHIVGIYKRAR